MGPLSIRELYEWDGNQLLGFLELIEGTLKSAHDAKLTPNASLYLVHAKWESPLEVDVNAQYPRFEYHYTSLIFCGFIVRLVIPGIGILYGGLARGNSALALPFQSLMVGVMNGCLGIKLILLSNSRPIGDLANFGLKNISAAPSGSPQPQTGEECGKA